MILKKGDKGFIFSINNNQIYYNKKINYNYNIKCNEYYSPSFGNFDIKNINNCDQNNYSSDVTYYNSAYNTPGNEYALPGKEHFYVLDYSVY